MGKRIVAPAIFTYALVAVIFHAYWGFLFKDTVYANTALTYLTFLLPLALLFATLIYPKRQDLPLLAIAWFPFLLWRFAGMIVNSSLEISSPWLVAMLIIFIASGNDILPRIPYKFFVACGLIVVLGILIEIIAPSFYFSNIYPIFIFEGTFDALSKFEEGYGCSGFMNQLGHAAIPMIFAEGVLLFMYTPDNGYKWSDFKKHLRIVGLVLLFVCIFLTGKRAASVVAVITPFIVYYIKSDKTKKFEVILLGMLGVIFAYILVLSFYGFLAESIGVGRLFETFSQGNGEDVNYTRDWRWEYAIKLFSQSPVFGNGVNCIEMSGHESVHNFYLQILAEQGVLGLLLFVVPMFFTLKTCIEKIRTVKTVIDKKALTCALFFFITVALHIIMENGDIFAMPIFFIAIAMVVSNRNNIGRKYYYKSF